MANSISPVTTAMRELAAGVAGYPERLSALGWPKSLHVRGVLGDGPAVAIVGARAATAVGMERAHALARHLAGRGVHVVSGGALGIDGAAHRGALAAMSDSMAGTTALRGRPCGTTTVVLGSGVDVFYPERHARLFDQILAHGGAVVSLLPAGTRPRSGTFLQRNPLISALADVVIVVEADVRSGSLSTAHAAEKQRRVVAAWPGSAGCDHLLARGAAVIEGVGDADAALAGSPRRPVPAALGPDADAVAGALAQGVRGIDRIAGATGLPVRAVLRALAVLESRYS